MKQLEKISKCLIIAAVGSLFFRRGIFYPYSFQPFEILILLALLATLITAALRKKVFVDLETEAKTKYWLKYLVVFLGFLTISLIYAYFVYNNINPPIIRGLAKDYFALLTNMTALLLIVYYSKDSSFIRNVLKIFLVLISLSIFLIAPKLIFALNVTEGWGSHFVGFHTSRTALGNLLFIPFAILISLFIKEINNYKKLIFWGGIVLILSLILWTTSLNAYLGTTLVFIFAILFSYNREKRWLWFGKYIVAILLTTALSYFLLPIAAKNAVVMRLFPKFAPFSNTSSAELKKIDAKPVEIISPYTDIKSPSLKPKDKAVITMIDNTDLIKAATKQPLAEVEIPASITRRINIWLNAFLLLAKNPLGLSTQFYSIKPAIKVDNDIRLGGGHNTFFQIGLSGGWGALILFVALIYKIFKSLKSSRDESWVWLALTTANFAIAITLLFDDRFFNPWIWILIALAINYRHLNDYATNASLKA